jgi:AcrR family transcriptional regulator
MMNMSKKTVSRGVSKAEWLEAGLEFLARGNVTTMTIGGLAKHLGIAKSGFYWHFKNRDELLRDLLQYWIHEITEVITANEKLRAMEPRARLQETAEILHDYQLTRYEMAFRQWARQDKEAARVVRKANRMRMEHVSHALAELGITGDEADMRAMVYICYVTWESFTFADVSRKKRRELIVSRIKLLTSK